MQFTTLFTLTPLVLAAFAAVGSAQSSQCDSGSIQCCNSVQAANSKAASTLLTLLGVVVQDVTAQVGLTCSPITAIGVSGNSCTQQTVCCSDNSFNGVVALGCTPINLNL